MKNKKYNKPSKFVYFLGRTFVYPFYRAKYNIHVDRKGIEGIKPPYVIVANHGTGVDPIFLLGCLKGVYMSPVGGYAYFKNPKMKWLLRKLGAISKFQYQVDLKSMKDMINVTRNGGVLCIFPTGRNSSCGEGFPIPDSLAKLLKMCKTKVVLCKIDGSYLSKPKWAKTRRKGRVDMTFSLLFNEEQVQDLETTEMTNILNEKLSFNEYDWNKNRQIKFKGKKLAEDLDNILYRCPECGEEFHMISSDNILKCECCGHEFKLLETGFFEENKYFESPFNYYEWQRESINELIKNDFKISDNVVCKMNLPEGILEVGKGVLFITNDSMIYEGTINGENKVITFDTTSLFSLPYRAGINIEIALDNDIYQFELENRYLPTKFCLIIEELYKKRNG